MINNSCIEIFVQDVTPIPLNSKELEAEEKPQKSLNEKQQVCYLLATLLSILPLERKLCTFSCLILKIVSFVSFY